ncbi:MAG: response regulator [Planctomycetes bacterium]|nr:response regulator [Planctomycetota bacterium]
MPKQILIVDDEPDTLGLLVEVLAMEGFEVLQAEDGAEALELCERQRPDLVLLDLMMPGLDGLEVALRIPSRIDGPAVPILVLTAQPALRKTVDQALERFGVTRVLEKPFRISEMVAEVRAILARKPLPRRVPLGP